MTGGADNLGVMAPPTVLVPIDTATERAQLVAQALEGRGLDVRTRPSKDDRPDVVVLTLHAPVTVGQVRQLCNHWSPARLLLDLPASAPSSDIWDYLQSGVAGTTTHADAPGSVAAAVEVVGGGLTVLPSQAAEILVRARDREFDLSPDDRRCLALLEDGHTIAALAETIGYSERTMYRLLNGLYRRLGVDNRYEAIAEAKLRGLTGSTSE